MAMDLLPAQHRWQPAERLNGLFSMTADNLPLLGPISPIPGLWSAVAVWVTHAAGAAKALAAHMYDEPTTIGALDPDRFTDQPLDHLRRRALAHYRDIYATS
jgi:glycine/D-amino acid oxidase-like deaminating enzyme